MKNIIIFSHKIILLVNFEIEGFLTFMNQPNSNNNEQK